ncbi:putative dehydrogenase [Kribbella sp. VKM Ac-2527]|uniref:Putative dehydrogenase n=1 Tax=Kribbella caucasensis TaxID=2512215 RepID=A0A4R6KJV4_9ACTN|nr:Gfo/Idh/MocA family oxidoreductase [Kribbella sp. VKM Ac-2527]TDO51598.1 putative dehydrogenase [Kribbella sp. VKM Ac-2527]
MQSTLGIGLLGAGPVTQAIHLPTLARLSDEFAIRHVTDTDPAVAKAIAARVGAVHSTSIDALLGDPAVEVVVICSPNSFHAEQLIAACHAGKKAVLCEKPLAMSYAEADAIATVSAETGVPIVVGAMHTFDPGWRAATAHWGELPASSHTIRSSIVLPPNSRFEDVATEVLSRPAFPAPDWSDVQVLAGMIHAGVMGLAIHDLPLVRSLLPRYDDLRMIDARFLAPFGYRILFVAGGKSVELHAVMSETWQPDWTLEAFSDDQALQVQFTPSYVHAGSAVSTLTTAESARVFGPTAVNGYEAEWRELAAIVRGEVAPPSTHDLVDDVRFALAVADASAEAVRSTHNADAAA